MSDPILFSPTVTSVGEAAAFNAASTGIELQITHVSFGTGAYAPTGNETALKSEVKRVTIAGGSRVSPSQIRMTSIWPDDSDATDSNSSPIYEVGFWAGSTLFSVWSRVSAEPMGYKTPGVDFVLFNDLIFKQLPATSVNITVDPDASSALAALAAHEGAMNAHPQYLLRRDVVQDSGSLAWCGAAGGTVNALVLTLVDAESTLTALEAGQRFQFIGAAANTGAVTANIESLGVVQVKKAGTSGLVNLEAGDIKAGAIFDLNFDGTYFQLGGGVGAGKTFTPYQYTATAGQKAFTFSYTPGAILATINGRLLASDDFAATDGATVTLTTGCTGGESVLFLCFSTFQLADAYTKAQSEAVKAQIGSRQGVNILTATTALNATYFGDTTVINAAAAATITLPAASAGLAGYAIELLSVGAGAVSVVPAGTDTISGLAAAAITSLSLVQGDRITLITNGAGAWYAVNGSISQTAPLFNNTGRSATTAFVQRALGNYAGFAGIPAGATTLTSAYAGLHCYINGTATLTLPDATTLLPGVVFSFSLTAGFGATATFSGSSSQQFTVGTVSQSTVVLFAGDSIELTSTGGGWIVSGGSFLVRAAAINSVTCFRVWPSATQSITANTSTKLTFAAKSFDVTGEFNVSTSSFTPLYAGYYTFDCCIHGTPATSGQRSLMLYVNGVEKARMQEVISSSMSLSMGGTAAAIKLAAGDVVTLYYSSTVADSIYLNETLSWFAGRRVS